MRLCPHRGYQIEDGKPCGYHALIPNNACRAFINHDLPTFAYDPNLFKDILFDLGDKFLTVEQEVKAPWFRWIENTMDFHHVKNVHKDFNEQLEGTPFDIRIGADKKNSSHRINVNKEKAHRFERIIGEPLDKTFLHILEYSRLSITSFMGILYSLETAVSNGQDCCVVTNFYLSKKRPVPPALVSRISEANVQILKEDKELVEKWAPTACNTGNWLPFEQRIRAFNECLKADRFI